MEGHWKLSKRKYLLEEILKSIKSEEIKLQMKYAANELYEEYASKKELTAFTSLDLETFYETK